jgi:hypothetical protein
MTKWFLSLLLLMCCITFMNLHMLNHPCILMWHYYKICNIFTPVIMLPLIAVATSLHPMLLFFFQLVVLGPELSVTLICGSVAASHMLSIYKFTILRMLPKWSNTIFSVW